MLGNLKLVPNDITSWNVLVLMIIFRFHRKTNSDFVFANLAVTDVIGGVDAVFASLLLLSGRRFFDYNWLDDVICQAAAITWCLISISTPLLLALISMGRYIAVFFPHRYDRWFRENHVIGGVVVTWLVGIIGSTMHLYKNENTRMEPQWGYCDYRLIDIYSTAEIRWIVMCLYCVPLVMATVVLVVCNTSIAVKLLPLPLQNRKRRKKEEEVEKGLGSVLTPVRPVNDTGIAGRLNLTKQVQYLEAGEGYLGDVYSVHPVLSNSLHHTFSRSETTRSDSPTIESAISGIRKKATETGHHFKRAVKAKADSVNSRILAARGSVLSFAKKRGSCDRQRLFVESRERNIISATLLFAGNFVLWNCILLYYYFVMLINPQQDTFALISGEEDVVKTYLIGWFYYATFLTSCANPIIHFVCSTRMRGGLRHLFNNGIVAERPNHVDVKLIPWTVEYPLTLLQPILACRVEM
eukprot:sb/3479506/